MTNKALISDIDAVEVVLALLPEHDISLSIEHNPHKVNYETVEEWFTYESDRHDRTRAALEADFVSPGEVAKAIAQNEMWEMQWYPNTPVGFNVRYASSLAALLGALPSNLTRL